MEHQQQEDPIIAFPPNALEPVAGHLPAEDVLRLAVVSRAWREHLGRAVLGVKLVGRTADEQAAAAAWLAKHLHRTRDLELDRWRTIHPSGYVLSSLPMPADSLLTAPAPRGNGLLRLSFTGCESPRLPSLACCTALKELNVSSCNNIVELPPMDAFIHQLTRLEVSYCDSLTHLPASLGRCSALVELRICDNERLTSLPSLDACTKLRTLTFSSRDYNSFQLPRLEALTGIINLELWGCRADTIPRLDAFQNLMALDVSGSNVLASQLQPLTACSRLTELTIDVSKDLQELPALEQCQQLQRLRVLRCDALQQLPILTSCTQLEHLECWGCDALQALPPHLPAQLQELNIYSCNSLTHLPDLNPSQPQLRRLHVGGKELRELPQNLSTCTRLEDLDCSNCPNLGKLPSLTSCARLQRLATHRCQKLTALPDLSSCTMLKELQCVGCTGLLDFPSLSSCGQLTLLQIDGCRFNSSELRGLPPDLQGCAQLETLVYRPWYNGIRAVEQLPDLSACTALKEVIFDYDDALSGEPDFKAWLEELQQRRRITVKRKHYDALSLGSWYPGQD